MKIIRGNDTIRGTDVTFTMEIDGKNYEFAHAKNWETTAEFNKDDVPRIGTRVVGKKNGTISYSGSCTCYYMDPKLRDVFMEFIRTGYWPEITATVHNHDKDSRACDNSEHGGQVAIHKGIKFDSITLSKFDAESTMLDEDLDFTFESVEIQHGFTPIEEFKD